MKISNKILVTALCIAAASCGKENDPEPYVPWRPEEVKEDSIALDKATRPMLLTEQASGKIVMIDQPTGKLAWDWNPAESNLSASQAEWFGLPDETKPIMDKSAVLVTASKGGVAIVNVTDKSVTFAAKPGGNPHSAEILPDGSVVVACSDGNKLVLYKKDGESIGTKAAFTLVMTAAHNVVWDKRRNCLWTASDGHIYKLSYDQSAPSLTQEYSYDLPGDNTMVHDMVPVYGKDILYVTTQQNVFSFNPETGEISSVDIFQKKDIKSISTGPDGWPAICTRPTSTSYWTSEVVDFKGNRLFSFFKYRIYKARWFTDQPFSY